MASTKTRRKTEPKVRGNQYKLLYVNELEPNPLNPRITHEEVADIVTSIARYGVLEPITVYSGKNGKMRIAEGHRRWFACQQVNQTQIPAIINYGLTDLEAAERALEVNSARKNLSPLEEALMLGKIKETHSLSNEALAERFTHWGPSGVHYRLKMLEYAASLQRAIHTGSVSYAQFVYIERLARRFSSPLKISLRRTRLAFGRKVTSKRVQSTKLLQTLMDAEITPEFIKELTVFLEDPTAPIGTLMAVSGHLGQQVSQAYQGMMTAAKIINAIPRGLMSEANIRRIRKGLAAVVKAERESKEHA